MSRHGAPGRALSPLLPSAIDHSSVLSELGFKIKSHLVLTVAGTSFVTFELFVSKMHNLGLGGGLHFGKLLSTYLLEAQGPWMQTRILARPGAISPTGSTCLLPPSTSHLLCRHRHQSANAAFPQSNDPQSLLNRHVKHMALS